MSDDIGWRVLNEGLTGVVNEIGGVLFIATLVAHPEGQGACSRYLDSLPRDRTVVALKVINPKLAGMLKRRGFEKGEVLLAGVEPVEAYIRHPEYREENLRLQWEASQSETDVPTASHTPARHTPDGGG